MLVLFGWGVSHTTWHLVIQVNNHQTIPVYDCF